METGEFDHAEIRFKGFESADPAKVQGFMKWGNGGTETDHSDRMHWGRLRRYAGLFSLGCVDKEQERRRAPSSRLKIHISKCLLSIRMQH